MNILHVSFTTGWRGGDVQMLTSFNLLQGCTGITQLILCYQDFPLAHQCAAQNLPFITTPKTSKHPIRAIKEIIKVVKEKQIDLVHVHSSTAHTLATIASFFSPGIKIVFSRKRDNSMSNTFFRRLKYNNSSLVKIICLSNAIRNVFDGVLNDFDKAVVIYDGIDVDLYASKSNTGILHRDYSLPQDALVVGNAAALVDHKDIVTFLDAAKIILQKSTKNIVFIILGDGILLQKLKAYSQELGIEGKVIFAGFRNDFADVLPEFDVLMMSSTCEGLPLTLLSAFAAKVPVSSTAAGGIGEVVKHRQTGMLAPIKNAAALAENTLALLDDVDLRTAVVANASTLIHEKFTLDIMRKNYYDFYSGLA